MSGPAPITCGICTIPTYTPETLPGPAPTSTVVPIAGKPEKSGYFPPLAPPTADCEEPCMCECNCPCEANPSPTSPPKDWDLRRAGRAYKDGLLHIEHECQSD